MSYLCYLCLFGSSLPPVVCRIAHVLFMLFVFVWFVFTLVVCRIAHVLFSCVVLCLFGSSLPPVVCRIAHVLFMLFVFVWFVFTLVVCRIDHVLFRLFVFIWFVFTSSCLQDRSCLIYVSCVCLVRLYLQLFVG